MVEEKSRRLNAMIQEALNRYDGHFNISNSGRLNIGVFSGMKYTKETKPYQLRADVPITFGNNPTQYNLVIIGFGPNQGTGDNSNYNGLVDQFGKPLTSQETPRDKTGLRYEVMLPLIDLNRTSGDELGRCSLDYIILNDTRKKAERISDFGVIVADHCDGIYTELDPFHHFHTLCYDEKDKRCGDPHAIYNPKPYDQVAGFISFRQE